MKQRFEQGGNEMFTKYEHLFCGFCFEHAYYAALYQAWIHRPHTIFAIQFNEYVWKMESN